MSSIDVIKDDIAALQAASATAAQELDVLSDQVAELQAGAITQEQIDNLHQSLQAVTGQLRSATEEAMDQTGQGGIATPAEGQPPAP
jgi:multidrug resistance efflux pump